MKKRKYIYKLIMLLLILSILLGEFAIRPISVQAVDLTLYTYWDLWYSISGAQHASMSANDGPFTSDDVLHMKTKWSTAWKNYNIWIEQNYPELSSYDMDLQNYLDAKANERDQARVQFQDFLFYLKDTASDLVPQAYDLINNAKTTGLEMSQELWDAFRQYFDDVANDKPIYKSYQSHTVDDLIQYVSNVTGIDTKRTKGVFEQYPQFANSNVCILEVNTGNEIRYSLYVPCNSYSGKWEFLKDSHNNDILTHSGDINEKLDNVVFYTSAENISYNCYGFYYSGLGVAYLYSEYKYRILSTDWTFQVNTMDKEYSPFIDYTVSQGCPVEVPETIPWRVYPKEETDDDTKIIPFPVEVPDEGTTEVPGEETTEKPNPDEDPDNDNDEDNDPFPGIFPWFPSAPEIPDFKPWVPDPDDDDPEPEPDPDPDPPPPPKDDDPEPEPDPDPDPPPPPGKVEGYLNKLKTKFPFCIPFDMVTLFKNLKKTQKAPKWTFSYTFRLSKNNSYTWKIVVDMADYDQYIQIFREGFFILFLVGLFFATRKLISWQID